MLFTIDWEDFGQLNHFYNTKEIIEPNNDIDRQTSIILNLLEKHDIKATFFVLGMLARFKPNLVKLILEEGHEIALHGNNHENLRLLTDQQIIDDISYSTALIQDIIGQKVIGYRAPFFSITRENYHVLKIISELGFVYDSSIYPASIARNSFPEFGALPKKLNFNSNTLYELPASVYKLPLGTLPIAGGGYFRLFNKSILAYFYKSLQTKLDYGMVYMHPYEFDNNKITVNEKSALTFRNKMENFKWNLNRHSIVGKLDYLFNNNRFITCSEYINELDG